MYGVMSNISLESPGSPHNALKFHLGQEQECILFLLEVKEANREQELISRPKDLLKQFLQSCIEEARLIVSLLSFKTLHKEGLMTHVVLCDLFASKFGELLELMVYDTFYCFFFQEFASL